MTFGESISVCFSKYADFDGRASRSEFWWFYVFVILLSFSLGLLLGLLVSEEECYDAVSIIVSLILVVPIYAVGARRLHDTGKSGWQQLWWFTIIGIIPLVIWWSTEGSKKSNKFGAPIDLSG